jgi:hypothetical protein
MQRRAVSVSQLPVAPKPCCDSSGKLGYNPLDSENSPMKEFWKAGKCGELDMPTAIRRL